MMVTTHMIVGALVGALVAGGTPLPVGFATTIGMLGGFLPDLDKVLVSRRTLHYPVLSFVVGGVLAGVTTLYSQSAAAAVAIFFLAAGLHSAMEVLGRGGGLSDDISDRAVYNHVTGEWMRAMYLIPETSVRELLLNTGVTAAVLVLAPGWPRVAAVILFGVSVVYALSKDYINRRIPSRFETMSDFIKALVGKEADVEWTKQN